MKNRNAFLEKGRGPLAISFILVLVISGIVGYMLMDFNNKEVEVTGKDTTAKVTVAMDVGCEKGERWSSSMFTADSPKRQITLVGETVKGTIANSNDYNIRNWTLTVAPSNECYLNGFWGGSIEFHQFRDGKEIVETVDKIVNNSDIHQLEVNPYVDAMMIRLLPGDYFVFEPQKQDDLDVIRAGDSIGIVFNMYYVKSLDFSDYSLCYFNDVKVKETWIYPMLFVLWTAWFVILLVFVTVFVTNKRMNGELNSSVQSIQAMAELYLETYIIELDKQTAYLIKQDREKALFQFDKKSIQEELDRYVEEDCEEVYVDDLKQFLNIGTIIAELKEASSIVFEYKSKSIDWCSIRIFKMDRKEETTKLVLAVQDINEERRKLHEIEEHIRQKENDVTIQGDFLDNTFFAMNQLIAVIRATSAGLANELEDSQLKMMALSVNDSIEHLHLLKNCVYDLFALDKERFVLKSEVYDVREMVAKLKSILTPFYMGKEYVFQIEIDSEIPERLRGDKERLMQILVVLLFSSMFITEKGFVRLSVFGKQSGNIEELVFSVRDTANGFSEEQVLEVQQIFREAKLKPVDNASLVYLQIMDQILRKMNSKMNLVSVYGSGSEFYFSLEQEIVNE